MLELLILAALAAWLALALRACRKHKGGCGGDCARCPGCAQKDHSTKGPRPGGPSGAAGE